MGLIISLKTGSKSYFKDLFHFFINKYKPDEVLICSGYYQENTKYSVIDDKDSLGVNSLASSLNKIEKVTFVGIHSKWKWKGYYEKLLEKLRDSLKPKKVTGYYDKEGRWHAKEVIMLKDDIPVVGIIGSSNFTRPAYGSDIEAKNNIEADTFIIPNVSDIELSNMIAGIRGDDRHGLVVASYNADANYGIGESDILKKHYQKIVDMFDNELEEI